jgi:hypothetical protein
MIFHAEMIPLAQELMFFLVTCPSRGNIYLLHLSISREKVETP